MCRFGRCRPRRRCRYCGNYYPWMTRGFYRGYGRMWPGYGNFRGWGNPYRYR